MTPALAEYLLRHDSTPGRLPVLSRRTAGQNSRFAYPAPKEIDPVRLWKMARQLGGCAKPLNNKEAARLEILAATKILQKAQENKEITRLGIWRP